MFPVGVLRCTELSPFHQQYISGRLCEKVGFMQLYIHIVISSACGQYGEHFPKKAMVLENGECRQAKLFSRTFPFRDKYFPILTTN